MFALNEGLGGGGKKTGTEWGRDPPQQADSCWRRCRELSGRAPCPLIPQPGVN